MTDALQDATRALRRAETTVESRRDQLAQAIADALRSGVRISEVARVTGYTREHVRRIARAHGVEGDPSRVPPPPPPRRA